MTSAATKQTTSSDRLAIEGGDKAVNEAIPLAGYGAELIGEEEERAVLDAIRSRKLCRITHPFAESYTHKFEEEVRKRIQAPYFHALNSCATALYAAMVGLEIGPGDEVLVSGAGWFSIANAVIAVGAAPVPVNFDESLTIDVDDLEARITKRTKAVIVVHWRGLPARMDRVVEIAKKHNIRVIEDCAQSFGGTYKGKALGTWGDVGCYSFNMHKMITSGEGGGIVTREASVFKRVVSLSGMYNFWNHQLREPNVRSMPDVAMLNFRLPELCGAMAYAQMGKLDTVLGNMRARNRELVAGLRTIEGITLGTRHDPEGDLGYTVPVLFPNSEKAERFAAAMKAEGVPNVSTISHAFSGGEARGTASLVISEGMDPAESGAMAFADTWRPMTLRNGSISNTLNPWKLNPEAPACGPEQLTKTRERLSRVMTFKLNPVLEPRHVELMLTAARKVARALPK
jgi:dTDP-4-amino-4,6-dideoxygalactose transaminase